MNKAEKPLGKKKQTLQTDKSGYWYPMSYCLTLTKWLSLSLRTLLSKKHFVSEVILDLQKSCKNSTEDPCMPQLASSPNVNVCLNPTFNPYYNPWTDGHAMTSWGLAGVPAVTLATSSSSLRPTLLRCHICSLARPPCDRPAGFS